MILNKGEIVIVQVMIDTKYATKAKRRKTVVNMIMIGNTIWRGNDEKIIEIIIEFDRILNV